jgi:hypothetical protein
MSSMSHLGSKTEVAALRRDVCFARVSGHRQAVSGCPKKCRYCSLIPGLGVKLSNDILAGPTVLSAVGVSPPHDGVRLQKVENRTTLKISRKSIFGLSLLRRSAAPLRRSVIDSEGELSKPGAQNVLLISYTST